jgi:hypothetical protein
MIFVTLFGSNLLNSYINKIEQCSDTLLVLNIPFPELLDIIIALASTTCPTIYNMLGEFFSSLVAPSDVLQTDGMS